MRTSEHIKNSNGINWQNKNWVYVIESSGVYKIGIAGRMRSRMSNLDSSSPSPVKLIMAFKSEDALTEEQALHSRFEHKHSKGEWFALNEQDIEELRKEFCMREMYVWGLDELEKYEPRVSVETRIKNRWPIERNKDITLQLSEVEAMILKDIAKSLSITLSSYIRLCCFHGRPELSEDDKKKVARYSHFIKGERKAFIEEEKKQEKISQGNDIFKRKSEWRLSPATDQI